MFVPTFLKGRPREFENLCIVVKGGQEKSFDEIKRDLINFESEKPNKRNYRETKCFLRSNDWIWFNCHKKGHIAWSCRAPRPESSSEKPNSKLTKFKCKKVGDIALKTFH